MSVKPMVCVCMCVCKIMELLQKTIWHLPNKLNIKLPYSPEIPVIGIFAGELKMDIQISIHELLIKDIYES